MADLEGVVRRGLASGLSDREILARLVDEIMFYKGVSWPEARAYAEAVLDETIRSLGVCGKAGEICPGSSGVSAGAVGIGSRGSGDFFFHTLLSRVADWGASEGGAADLDDAGWVRAGDLWIVAAVDGIHSRLSYFPLIAGFHAARAAARDVMVKGAEPLLFAVDLRVGDDGDPGHLLELEAGVAAVSRFLGAPVAGGSTLRIGGDMVIGTRVVGTVMCVGASRTRPKARRAARPGDVMIMTKGSGGGTIATAAIFSGRGEVVERTINFNTLAALRTLIRSGLVEKISAMFDVTNGGLRGDLNEISKKTGAGFVVDVDKAFELVDEKVLEMLLELGIDPLGVSLDSVVIFAGAGDVQEILEVLSSAGVPAGVVGGVTSDGKALQRSGGSLRPLEAWHRESPYTRIKRLVGTERPEGWDRISRELEAYAERAERLRDWIFAKALERTSVRIPG